VNEVLSVGGDLSVWNSINGDDLEWPSMLFKLFCL